MNLPVTDYVLIFTILTFTIMVAPLLARKTRIPDLVILLAAGAVLGPHGLGILERISAITLFGEIGLLYIMFLAGLEIDLYQFSRTRKRCVGFGLLTFVIPQVGGAVVVHYALGLAWAPALLMASMFASHTLLAYPVANRLGIHKSEPVTISVGATIITDTLALLVLAVVVDSAQDIALNLQFWAGIVGGLVLLVALISQLIPRMARWFFQNVTESGPTQFLFVLTVVCACAYFSQFARMKPLIGAFLAGAAFNRLIPEQSPLMNRLVFVGNTLFIPFFLISVGMLVKPEILFSELRTWQIIATMVGLVVTTKLIAAWFGGKWLGYTVPERCVVFGLTVVQAAATLAAALVGFEAGLLSEAALNGAIAMIMVTVPLGTWIVDRYGRKMAMASRPAPQREQPTEQRLVLAVVNPTSAARITDLAFLVRDPALPGGIYPLTIVREQTDTEEAVAEGEKLLALCMARASSAEIQVDPNVRVDLNPADGIVRAARELRASTVFAGWPDGGPRTRVFSSSVNANLAENCPSRLMLCRILFPPNTTRVLRLPFPPLAERREDLSVLIRETKLLAKQIGADLFVYLAGQAATELRRRLEKTSPDCKTQFIEEDTWTEARKRLFDDTGEEDLIVLPQIRRNALLWTPTLDRLPDLMAERFPKTNLLVVFPAKRGLRSEESAPVAIPASETFPAVHGVDFTPDMTDTDRLRHLVDQGLADYPGVAEEAYPLLKDSAEMTPVELAPEVVLIHGHCGRLDQPVLVVGNGPPSDAPFLNMQTTPKVIVALLSPKNDTPEIHLRALAAVARRFRNPDIHSAVQNVQSAAEICTLLARTDPSS
ncbi:MAG: cation:proton antiporter [Verrucomicrobiota bacterium]